MFLLISACLICSVACFPLETQNNFEDSGQRLRQERASLETLWQDYGDWPSNEEDDSSKNHVVVEREQAEYASLESGESNDEAGDETGDENELESNQSSEISPRSVSQPAYELMTTFPEHVNVVMAPATAAGVEMLNLLGSNNKPGRGADSGLGPNARPLSSTSYSLDGPVPKGEGGGGVMDGAAAGLIGSASLDSLSHPSAGTAPSTLPLHKDTAGIKTPQAAPAVPLGEAHGVGTGGGAGAGAGVGTSAGAGAGAGVGLASKPDPGTKSVSLPATTVPPSLISMPAIPKAETAAAGAAVGGGAGAAAASTVSNPEKESESDSDSSSTKAMSTLAKYLYGILGAVGAVGAVSAAVYVVHKRRNEQKTDEPPEEKTPLLPLEPEPEPPKPEPPPEDLERLGLTEQESSSSDDDEGNKDPEPAPEPEPVPPPEPEPEPQTTTNWQPLRKPTDYK